MQERIEQDTPQILSVVWNLIRGGTEGQCARVAMGLTRAGSNHQVAVFRREGFFLEEVEALCGPVYDVGIERMFTVDTWRRINALAVFIREQKIDLVHLWDIDAVIFGAVAARKAGVPYLTSRRDMGEIYPKHKLAMMKWADQGAQGIVVNAQAIADLVDRLGIETPVHVMPNIIDIAEFDRLAEKELPDLPGDRFLVGMVARLDPEKDVSTFLRGLAEARKTHPTILGVIAGDGVERESLEALAADLELGPDALRFLGEFHDVPALVRRLDVGVLVPRSNEGLSNTILEYLAGGIPVIATDCGGNAELVRSGETGWLIQPGDVSGLSRYLCELIENVDEGRALGQAGRQWLEQHHAPEQVFPRFIALYQEGLNQG